MRGFLRNFLTQPGVKCGRPTYDRGLNNEPKKSACDLGALCRVGEAYQ